jgi:hypothetical protein
MFDYVRCEVPLPDGFDGELQTKDLNRELVTHVITKDGRLIREWITHTTEVPNEERPYPNDEGIRGLIGSVKIHTDSADAEFHGILNFYGTEGEHGEPSYRWHEYNAKFTDGQLVGIDEVRDATP